MAALRRQNAINSEDAFITCREQTPDRQTKRFKQTSRQLVILKQSSLLGAKMENHPKPKIVKRFSKIVRDYRKQVAKTETPEPTLEAFALLADHKLMHSERVAPHRLAEETRFTWKEIQELYRRFKQLSPVGFISEDHVCQILTATYPYGESRPYAQILFASFDVNQNGQLSFQELLVCLSAICRGSLGEKLEWLYGLYDPERIGFVSEDQIEAVLLAINRLIGDGAIPRKSESAVKIRAKEMFKKLDRDRDGMVSKEDFLVTCSTNPTIINSINVFSTRNF